MPKVDLAHYLDREQAYVKHCLLEQYLPDLIYRVGRNWDAIVYIDGFAGPWQTTDPDYADSSFGVAIRALRECQRGLQDTPDWQIKMKSILVEADKSAFSALKRFADAQNAADFEVHALQGEFADSIPSIEKRVRSSVRNPFQFVFLDPKGWAQIPMRRLRPFLNNRSCEVLINLMTIHIVRFLGEPSRADSYNELFGRDEVLNTLQQLPQDDRMELAVQEYSTSLRVLCNFKYVSAAVIFKPATDGIAYFLVYGTNHPRGVEVFKAAELSAARIQDEVRQETHVRKTRQPGLLFDDAPPSSPRVMEIRKRYLARAQAAILNLLWSQTKQQRLLYEQVLCEAIAFPLVSPNDVVRWLNALKPDIGVQLMGTGRRKPNPLQHDEVIVINPQGLKKTGKARLQKV